MSCARQIKRKTLKDKLRCVKLVMRETGCTEKVAREMVKRAVVNLDSAVQNG